VFFANTSQFWEQQASSIGITHHSNLIGRVLLH